MTQIDTVGSNSIAKIAYGGRFGGSNVPGVLFYGSGANIRYRTAASGAVTNGIAFPGGTVQTIVFDPENWRTAFIIGNTTVYSANDIPANGAAAFTNITGNLTGVGTMHTIEYLTLPSGNAIVVGTDIGAYIMRVASPGVWRTLGNNLPHAPVYDSHFDAAGQVLTVSCFGRGSWLFDFKPNKADGQYGETFQGYTDNTTTFPSRVGELFSNQLGAVARIVDNNFHELQLIDDGVGWTHTAFRLPDLNPGQPVTAFSAKWNAQIYGDAACGCSRGRLFLQFRPARRSLGRRADEQFCSAGGRLQRGPDRQRADLFRQHSRLLRARERHDGPRRLRRQGFGEAWGDFNPTRHFFEVDWRMDTGLTLRVDGVAIFTNLATPGFVPAAGDRFVFGARTGGLDPTERGSTISPSSPTACSRQSRASRRFMPAAKIAPHDQAADEAFDGNANTKWLTPGLHRLDRRELSLGENRARLHAHQLGRRARARSRRVGFPDRQRRHALDAARHADAASFS